MENSNFFSGYNKSLIDDIKYFIEARAGKSYAEKELASENVVSFVDLSDFENEPQKEAFYRAYNNKVADTFCYSTALLSFVCDYKVYGILAYLNFIEKLMNGTVFLYMRNKAEQLLHIDLNYAENFGLYDIDVARNEVFAWSHDGEDGIIYVSAEEYMNHLRNTAEKELEKNGINKTIKEKAKSIFKNIDEQEYDFAFSLMSSVEDLDFLYKLSTKRICDE